MGFFTLVFLVQLSTGASVQLLKIRNESNDVLTWLHIPKCGTSFVNTLVTWGCPRLNEKDMVTPEDVEGPTNGPLEWVEKRSDQCDESRLDVTCGHDPLGKGEGKCNLEKGKGANNGGGYVAMFRQPEQRAISGFYHHKWGYPNASGVGMVQYAQRAAGCQVKMLTGRECMDPAPVTNQDVEKAVNNLALFRFVGLTDQWELSVCLFHKVFGGDCHTREFQNIRAGSQHAEDLYDVKLLKGFLDVPDGALYQKVTDLFWYRVQLHNLTYDSCQSWCAPTDQS